MPKFFYKIGNLFNPFEKDFLLNLMQLVFWKCTIVASPLQSHLKAKIQKINA